MECTFPFWCIFILVTIVHRKEDEFINIMVKGKFVPCILLASITKLANCVSSLRIHQYSMREF